MLQEGLALLQEGETEEAVSWFEKSVQAGQRGAAVELASCLLTGCGVDADPDRACAVLEKAAAEGDTACMLELASLARYQTDRTHWLRKAAEAGDAVAARRLGLLLASCARGRKTGLQWLERAAELGDGQAGLVLGKRAAKKEDHKAAFELFERAAKAGSVEAATRVGRCLLKGQGCAANVHDGSRGCWTRQTAATPAPGRTSGAA
jgi:TPR repeat protein